MKAFLVAGVIGFASTCLVVAIYKGAVSPIELKPANLFTSAKAMEKGTPGPPPALENTSTNPSKRISRKRVNPARARHQVPRRRDCRSKPDALARKPGAIVRFAIIDRRSLRDDAHGVEPRDRPIVDDVVARLHGLGDAGHLVEVAHVA